MKKLTLFIFLLIITQKSLFAQIKIGEKINLLQANLLSVDQSKLDPSKIIVIDFWATWCGPCIAAFPHLDSLQAKYKKQVQIIALSDEKPLKVISFLKGKKKSLSFFIDQRQQVFKRFEIETRPFTAILDSKRTLIWVGSSQHLEDALKKIIKGEEAPVYLNQNSQLYRKYYANGSTQNKDNFIYNYQLSLSATTDKYEVKTQKDIDSAVNIYYRAAPVTEVVQDILQVPDLQFKNRRAELDTILVNINLKSALATLNYKTESKKVLEDLKRIFNFSIKEGLQQVEGYKLAIIHPEKLMKFKEELTGGGIIQSTEKEYKILRVSLNELAGFFQKKLKLFISCDEMTDAKYNMELEKFNTIYELNEQLKGKYGLQLLPSTYQINKVEVF